MEFTKFDAGYVQRLASGDAAAEEHFTRYFGELIFVKLRARQYTRQSIEDIRQETFLRVYQALRRDGIRQPERIGAFVNAICNNVVLEFSRAGSRMTFLDEAPEPAAGGPDFESDLIDRERRAQVRNLVSRMSPRNQKLLRALFLEGRAPDDVCGELGIDRNYLRVLLFRARTELKQALQNGSRGAGGN